MRTGLLIIVLLITGHCFGQYYFTGQIDTERWHNQVYLSVVDDYRKMNGVFNEQIIAQTSADSHGNFEFRGDNIETSNRIYRLHVDNCSDEAQAGKHFSGHCPDGCLLYTSDAADE